MAATNWEIQIHDNEDKTALRPPRKYAQLIHDALNSTESKKMTLNDIYNYILDKFPYFKTANNGWKNSIRHNLSLNKAFARVPRPENEKGKGSYWTIVSGLDDRKKRQRKKFEGESSQLPVLNFEYADFFDSIFMDTNLKTQNSFNYDFDSTFPLMRSSNQIEKEWISNSTSETEFESLDSIQTTINNTFPIMDLPQWGQRDQIRWEDFIQ